MKSLKMVFVITALGLVLSAGPAFAQGTGTQPPAQPPAKPAAPAPAPTQPTAPKPEPRPFPEGAKYAYVDIQYVANNSVEGKVATTRLQDLQKKKMAELTDKNKKIEDLQKKLQTGGSVLSDAARAQTEKDIEKLQRELQFEQQDAQTEYNDMQQQLLGDFQTKLNPIIEAVAKEKGLWMIFSVGQDGNIVWADTGLNLSDEITKRFDAAAKTAPKK
jgi:Skp family chaperone for outer membrane proteins